MDEITNPDVTKTRTYLWNLSDLDAPALIGFHDSTTTATDHNQYVKGNYTYQSNYRAGLRILDITDIAHGNLSEVAFFDVVPSSDAPGSDTGTWSNYPFFASGIVVVSTIDGGLFILRPNLVDTINPVLRSAAVVGDALTLTYGEALDRSSTPATGDFTVNVESAGRTVSNVAIGGSTVTLTLDPAVEHGDTGITVSYRVPGTNPIRDAVGNDADGLSEAPVTNTTGAPNTAPEIITSRGLLDVRGESGAGDPADGDRCRPGGRGHGLGRSWAGPTGGGLRSLPIRESWASERPRTSRRLRMSSAAVRRVGQGTTSTSWWRESAAGRARGS